MTLRAAAVIAPLLAVALGLAACRAPDPAALKQQAIQRGDELAGAKKFAEAAVAYRQAVDAAPEDGPLRLKLARALEGAAQWTPAANQAMRAADLMPTDYDARFLAARLILGQNRFEDALRLLEALAKERPDDAGVLMLRGTAKAKLINPTWALFTLASTGGTGPDYEKGCTTLRPRTGPEQDREAEADLQRALTLTPTSLDARLALLNFFYAARRADDGAPLIRQLVADAPQHGLVAEVAGHFYLARGEVALGEQYLETAAVAAESYSHAPRLALANHFFERGRYQDALTHWDKLTPADDEGGVISARRADALLRLQRYDEAGRLLDTLLARYPQHRRALALKAMLLVKQQRPAEALAVAREAAAADRTSAESRLVLAETLVLTGDLEAALAEYAETLRLAPAQSSLLPVIVDLALRTGRDAQALAYARQAAGLFPNDVDAKLAVVTASNRLHDYAGAATALQPLLALSPRPAAVAVQLGVLEAGRGRDDAARAAFSAALKTQPNSLPALSGLIDLDLSRGRVAAARARIDAVLAERSNDAGVLAVASRVFRAERNLPGAEAVLRRAVAQRPDDMDVILQLADCLVDLARYQDARTLLDGVLARNPASGRTLIAMGAAQEGLGQLDEAEARYKKVLAVSPDDGAAATRLALLQISRGKNLDIALGHLSEAKRARPADAAVSDALGWVYVQKGFQMLALEQLQEATRLAPANALYHYHLGVAHARDGAPAKARAALTRALALDLDDAGRKAAQAALNELGTR